MSDATPVVADATITEAPIAATEPTADTTAVAPDASAAAVPAAAAAMDESTEVKGDATEPVAADAAAEETKTPVAAGDAAASGEDASASAAAATPKKSARRKSEPKSATADAAPLSGGTSIRGRERKATAAFVPPSPVRRAADEFIVESGSGVELGEIESLKKRLDGINAQSEEVKALFHACFPQQRGGSAKGVIKKHIRSFSGYVSAQSSSLAKTATERLERYDNGTLKLVAKILGVGESGTKQKLIEHIIEFLTKPTSGSKKRKSTGSAAAAASDKKKSSTVKRANPFMLFCSEFRDATKKKYPDLATKDIARKLGEKWNGLSDSAKQKYKDRAAAGDEAAAPGSDDESSEDEEEEEEEEQPKKKKKSSSSLSAEWESKFTASIGAIISSADLSTMTIGKVKAELVTQFGELVVEANADGIKKLVIECIQKQTAK